VASNELTHARHSNDAGGSVTSRTLAVVALTMTFDRAEQPAVEPVRLLGWL
jgi:hypothetical protein